MYSIEISGVDKTDLLATGSLMVNKGADNHSDCSLSLISNAAYCELLGLDLKVMDGAAVVFGGVIKTVNMERLDTKVGATAVLRIDITSNGYNDIPSRRTTTYWGQDETAGTIVTNLLTNVLNMAGADENITAGTIDDGATFSEYINTGASVKTILDEMANASGYKWYIDDTKTLYFVAEDTVVDAAHDIVEGGAFTDYYIRDYGRSLENYRNKQFVRGEADADGILVQVDVSDTTEIAARQTAEGASYSSGVYGIIEQNRNIQSEADATTLANKLLQKYSVLPATLRFSSFTNDWVAGTKLKVNLPTFGISSDKYFLIENVSIIDADGVNLQSIITATARNAASFSTQRSENFVDYFQKLAENSNSYGKYTDINGDLHSLPNLWVQPAEPTAAKTNDVWVDTDDYSRYDLTPITTTATLDTDDSEAITVSGTFALTLHAATSAGIIKKVYNIGTGIVTLTGTINGAANMPLYPGESVELVTDGTGWGY